MKKCNIVKSAVLTASIAAVLSTTTSYADVISSLDHIKVQPSALYQANRGEPLADTLAKVAQRSGIIFKINTDLGKDVVSQSIVADNWNMAVRSLLVNYNFITIQDNDTIKTVIISGRNSHAADTGAANTTIASADDVIIIDPPQSIMHGEREWSPDEHYPE